MAKKEEHPSRDSSPKTKRIIMKKSILLIIIVLLWFTACYAETWEEWVAKCKSYKDVDKWMAKNFLYDFNRLKEAMSRKKDNLLEVNPPEISFKLRRGVCFDAAVFAKHSLNRINPDYKAEIVHLYPGYFPDHYVCGFFVEGKLYIMDRGTGYRNVEGTYGPFQSLDEYVNKIYLRYHPKHRKLKWARFGWPPWRSNEKW